MAHEHVTRDLLLAVLEDHADSSDLLRRLFDHLADLCPECRDALSCFRDADPSRPAASLLETVTVPPEFWTEVEEERAHRESTLLPAAQEELESLLDLPRAQQQTAIESRDESFRNPVLVQLLLDLYWERVTEDADEARHLAHLALLVSDRVSTERYGLWLCRDLALRSRACMANALRAAGDLRSADRHMSRVLDDLESCPEPLLRAEIFSFAASLRRDQRRFEDAEDLLDEALDLYRQVNDPPKAASVLINRANLRQVQGQPRQAGEIYRDVLALIDREEHPRLFLHAQHNLASCLCDTGEYEKARERLESHADLSEQHPDAYVQLRRRWLQGRIALGLGESDAEERLLEIRDAFAGQDLGYDAALVNLDLALLYTEKGRPADVRKLAEEMLPIFQSQDIHREALAALLIFRRAAAEETVSTQMVRDLAGYLRQARHDPRGRRELPS